MSELSITDFISNFQTFIQKVDHVSRSRYCCPLKNDVLSLPITKLEHHIEKFSLPTSRIIDDFEGTSPINKGSQESFGKNLEIHAWSNEHDSFLLKLVYSYSNNWKKVQTRIWRKFNLKVEVSLLKAKYQSIKSKLNEKKGKFDEIEDQKLLELIEIHGTNWMKISNLVEGRNPITVKNRYYYLKRIQQSDNN